MAIDDDNDAYAIGYGHPPKHSRFQKGTSGNKRGRPKGSKSVATVFHNQLNRRITVNESGNHRTITKLEAVIIQVVNKAAAGDPKAMQTLMQISRELGDLKIPDIQRRVMIKMNLHKPHCLKDQKED